MITKVKFKDKIYWLAPSKLPGIQNLSPLHHYSDDGNLTSEAWNDYSYAIVQNGEILRYGQLIGLESDLVRVE